jgi:hypothetical protein
MFIGLFSASFVLALIISALIAGISKPVVESILHRFLAERIAIAVSNYFRYAVLVVGIADGTRSRLLFDYVSVSPWERAKLAAELTPEFWALEMYRTTVQTLEGILGLVFVFSFVTFVAIVLIRKANLKDLQPTEEQN